MEPSLTPAAPEPVRDADTGMIMRPLRSEADFAACIRLQRRTWGDAYTECVPATILKVTQHVGGVAAGAFSAEGELAGFVYGLTGVERGRLIHWSHMLAVEPAHRNRGIGRRLKEFQRDVLRGQGVAWMYWTFDPLVARNAHLNLNRLGAVVREYVQDMYGDTGSELHAFGTDRLVVAWRLTGGHRAPRAGRPTAAIRGAPIANAAVSALADAVAGRPAWLRVEIPADIETMQAADLTLARAWRSSTRAAFARCAGDGYVVYGFYRDGPERCYYALTRAQPADDAFLALRSRATPTAASNEE